MDYEKFLVPNRVLKICNELKVSAPIQLVHLVAQSVIHSPKFGFDSNIEPDDDEVERLVKITVAKLSEDHGPVMETMRMQVHFWNNYKSHKEIVDEHCKSMERRLGPLVREITDSQARTRRTQEELYEKIVSAVILRSGLGNPTSQPVQRQTRAVLQSVFAPNQINAFMAQSRYDQRLQLRELTKIVAGIRISNWDSQRSGVTLKTSAGIDDLPGSLSEAMETTMNHLGAMKAYCAEKVAKYTTTLEALLFGSDGKATEISERDKKSLRFGLVNLRQFQIFLSVIIQDVESCNQRLSHLDQRLLNDLNEVQASLSSKVAVPTESVFPNFIRLANTWSGFQEEMVVLATLNQLTQSIHAFTKCLCKLPIKQLIKELNLRSFPSDDERMEERERLKSVDQTGFKSDCHLVAPGLVPDYDSILRVLGGFCPVALVHGHGFLLPGNHRLGILRVSELHFECSTPERMEQFGRSPDQFVFAIKKLIREQPVYRNILGEFESKASGNRPPPAVREESVQTPTHIETGSQRDPLYKWNEWDLRREALRLVRGRERTSHGSQTTVSFRRREAGSQATAFDVNGGASKSGNMSQETRAQRDQGFKKKSIVVGLKKASGSEVEHQLLEDFVANM